MLVGTREPQVGQLSGGAPLGELVRRERREVLLGQADVVAKHRAASPGDRFLVVLRGAQGRKRLR
jgi:hypothetical protein